MKSVYHQINLCCQRQDQWVGGQCLEERLLGRWQCWVLTGVQCSSPGKILRAVPLIFVPSVLYYNKKLNIEKIRIFLGTPNYGFGEKMLHKCCPPLKYQIHTLSVSTLFLNAIKQLNLSCPLGVFSNLIFPAVITVIPILFNNL